MGFTTLFDIVSSVIVGGLLLTLLFDMRNNAAEMNIVYQQDEMIITNLISVSEVMEFYLSRLGYTQDYINAKYSDNFIDGGSTTSFSFRGDVDDDGVMDQIEISLGDLQNSTPNPDDKILNVYINGNKYQYTTGIDSLEFEFYNFAGNKLPAPLNSASCNALFSYTIKTSMVDVYQTEKENNKNEKFIKTIGCERRRIRGSFTR